MRANEILAVTDYNTEIRLFDSNGKPKSIWNENKLGKALRNAGFEVRLPGVTGSYGEVAYSHNLVTNAGKAFFVGRAGNVGSYSPATYLAIGTGTTAAAAADTALETEITTNGGARAAATVTQTTTTVSNDTLQLQHTWTFTGSEAVTEEGIFTESTAGTLVAHQVFAAVNVASGDSLQITHTLTA
jgi:hypothetical protein